MEEGDTPALLATSPKMSNCMDVRPTTPLYTGPCAAQQGR